jgi:hypothetical protein
MPETLPAREPGDPVCFHREPEARTYEPGGTVRERH